MMGPFTEADIEALRHALQAWQREPLEAQARCEFVVMMLDTATKGTDEEANRKREAKSNVLLGQQQADAAREVARREDLAARLMVKLLDLRSAIRAAASDGKGGD